MEQTAVVTDAIVYNYSRNEIYILLSIVFHKKDFVSVARRDGLNKAVLWIANEIFFSKIMANMTHGISLKINFIHLSSFLSQLTSLYRTWGKKKRFWNDRSKISRDETKWLNYRVYMNRFKISVFWQHSLRTIAPTIEWSVDVKARAFVCWCLSISTDCKGEPTSCQWYNIDFNLSCFRYQDLKLNKEISIIQRTAFV